MRLLNKTVRNTELAARKHAAVHQHTSFFFVFQYITMYIIPKGGKTCEPYKNMTLHDQTGEVFNLKQKVHSKTSVMSLGGIYHPVDLK